MLLEVNVKVLKKALAENLLVTNAREDASAFKSLKLETTPAGLKLFTQSPFVKILNDVEAEVKEPGLAVVPADLFYRIFAGFDGETVSLRLMNNGSLRVMQGSSIFGVPVAADPTFMSFMEKPNLNLWPLSPDVFLHMFERTTFVCVKDANSYRSTVQLEPSQRGLVMTATDGIRLSTIVTPDINISQKCRLNLSSCQVLMRLLKSAKEFAAQITASEFIARIDNKTVYLNLSAIQFPNYRNIFPTGPCSFLVMDRPYLLNRLKQMNLISHLVQFKLEPDVVELKVNSEAGIGHDRLKPLPGSTVTQMYMRLNVSYLIEALERVNAPEIKLELRNPEDIVLIRGDEGHLQLIAPWKDNA